MDDPQRQKPAPGSMADTMRTVGALSTVGLSFVFAIAIGAGLGWYLDKAFGTAPWMFFLFFAIGVAAGILNVYRTAGRFLK
jgi:ATP synthase protein I